VPDFAFLKKNWRLATGSWRRPPGFTRLELILAIALILIIGVPMLLGVLDQRRRADDAWQVSKVRQAQAAIETYRAKTGSYPSRGADLPSEDAELAEGFGYVADPAGCAPDLGETCRSYALTFALKGPVGLLAGKKCSASPQGLLCAR